MKRTHLKIIQGMPFQFVATVKYKDESGDFVPMPLTGCHIRLQARSNPSSSSTLLDLSSDGKGITVDEEGGVFTLYLSSDQTRELDWSRNSAGRPVYQCEIQRSDGDDIRVLEGTISLDREVVR